MKRITVMIAGAALLAQGAALWADGRPLKIRAAGQGSGVSAESSLGYSPRVMQAQSANIFHSNQTLAFLPIEVIKAESIEVKSVIAPKQIEVYDTRIVLRGLDLHLTFVDAKTGKEKERQDHPLYIPSAEKQKVTDMLCKKFGFGPAWSDIIWKPSPQNIGGILYILDANEIVSPETEESFKKQYKDSNVYVLSDLICSKTK